MTREPPRSRIRPHPFVVDPELGADWFGRRTCLKCRIVGEPGDVHHPAEGWRPGPAEAAALSARILGERDVDDLDAAS